MHQALQKSTDREPGVVVLAPNRVMGALPVPPSGGHVVMALHTLSMCYTKNSFLRTWAGGRPVLELYILTWDQACEASGCMMGKHPCNSGRKNPNLSKGPNCSYIHIYIYIYGRVAPLQGSSVIPTQFSLKEF